MELAVPSREAFLAKLADYEDDPAGAGTWALYGGLGGLAHSTAKELAHRENVHSQLGFDLLRKKQQAQKKLWKDLPHRGMGAIGDYAHEKGRLIQQHAADLTRHAKGPATVSSVLGRRFKKGLRGGLGAPLAGAALAGGGKLLYDALSGPASSGPPQYY